MAIQKTEREEIVFEIKERIGIITEYPTGWNRELNLVSWNGSAPKYDIRDWNPEHDHMSRGITFHPKEMRTFITLLKDREI